MVSGSLWENDKGRVLGCGNISQPFCLPFGNQDCITDDMPTVKCKVCRDSFYAKPNWLRRGWGKYCSTLCQHEALKNGKLVSCFICKEQTYKTRKELRVSKSKKYFCSKSCQTIWRNTMVFIGSNHANWKGGESTYRDILIRTNVPQICKLCRIKDGRILAVHHIDRNRKNNSLNNLAWLCHNCHFLIHHYNKERQEFMVLIA